MTQSLRIVGTRGGHDAVFSSIGHVLGDNLEDLNLSGEGNIGGIGNAADNAITGNAGNNRLSGLDGNDTIFGDYGNDSLFGGCGDDSLEGGAGNDVVLGGDGNDTLQLTDGGDTLSGGAGDDTFVVSDYWTLGYEIIEGDIVVPLAPVIRGGAGTDTLKVGYADGAFALFDFAGIEVLDVQAWSPTYLSTTQLRGLQSITTSDDPGGLVYVIVTDGGAVDFARLLGDGQGIMAASSGGVAVRFASGSGADYLYGSGEGDRLSGGAGSDLLTGYGGNDTLMGGGRC